MYKDEEERKQKNREARARATKKYQEANYDRILAVTPKGTKQRIESIKKEGGSVSGYVTAAILEKLDTDEGRTPDTRNSPGTVCISSSAYEELKTYGDPDKLTAEAVAALLDEYRHGIR